MSDDEVVVFNVPLQYLFHFDLTYDVWPRRDIPGLPIQSPTRDHNNNENENRSEIKSPKNAFSPIRKPHLRHIQNLDPFIAV